MKTPLIALALVVASLPSAYGLSAGWSSGNTVVIAVPEPRTVSVALVMPADFVSVPIEVVSEEKNAAVAYEETRRGIELIAEKAKANGSIRVSTGVASLSQRRSSFGISSGSWKTPAAATQIHLLVPLTKERDDIFTAGADAVRFVESLRLPGKVRCELGKVLLAVDNPEQYRAKLLAQIAQEIKNTREAMGSQGDVKVEGLESSVMVRQADDRQVELFLDYSFSLTMHNDRQPKP